ncbi:hypothetical protein DEO72_LG6g102 [Vigna unguiculata]|uniref:Uncharacterized protein n=1 Tax=Vigna unguiculata TaxID=3917 RepID=A0A4D6M291_VIGUN|nr:hypothetical protein DEO72_LG6g102 [Vigna unguiculata]
MSEDDAENTSTINLQFIVEIHHQILTTIECFGFRPHGRHANMPILFAYNTFMHRQRRKTGLIKRVVLSPFIVVAVEFVKCNFLNADRSDRG